MTIFTIFSPLQIHEFWDIFSWPICEFRVFSPPPLPCDHRYSLRFFSSPVTFFQWPTGGIHVFSQGKMNEFQDFASQWLTDEYCVLFLCREEEFWLFFISLSTDKFYDSLPYKLSNFAGIFLENGQWILVFSPMAYWQNLQSFFSVLFSQLLTAESHNYFLITDVFCDIFHGTYWRVFWYLPPEPTDKFCNIFLKRRIKVTVFIRETRIPVLKMKKISEFWYITGTQSPLIICHTSGQVF